MAFDIDVGGEAINRAQYDGFANYTCIDTHNPANNPGIISQVEVYLYGAATAMKVGLFYLVSGTTYKCRASASLGNVASGSKQTFAGLSLAVQAGDVIGWYGTAGSMEFTYFEGSGYLYKSGDYCDPDDEVAFTDYNGSVSSCYGQGNTAEVKSIVGMVMSDA